MPKFYFTYGLDPAYPYQGGWTEIEAPTQPDACMIFKMFHPNQEGTCLNFADVYTEAEFQESGMDGPTGNLGAFCQEAIFLLREEFTNKEGDRS